MATVRSNMHQSKPLDQKLTENTGNDDVILLFLLDAFRKYFPKVADEIEESEKIRTGKFT